MNDGEDPGSCRNICTREKIFQKQFIKTAQNKSVAGRNDLPL